MHNLFLVYFVNLYMFREYLGFQSNQDNRQSSKRIISTNCCIHTVVPPDDELIYAQNVWSLKKYTKNKFCIKLVFLYTIIFEMHGQQNKIWSQVLLLLMTLVRKKTKTCSIETYYGRFFPFLLLHRAFFKFTDYHTQTNALLYIILV